MRDRSTVRILRLLVFRSARDLQKTVHFMLRRHLQSRPTGRSNGAKWAGKTHVAASSCTETHGVCAAA